MKIEIHHQFVKPHPIPELGGKLGLYSYEIAASLGIGHKNVIEKAKKVLSLYQAQGWTIAVGAAIPARGGKGGKPMAPLAFCLMAAKAFVAKWDNEKGIAYLAYLLACEGVVERAGIDPVAVAPILPPPKGSGTIAMVRAMCNEIERHEGRINIVEGEVGAVRVRIDAVEKAATPEAIKGVVEGMILVDESRLPEDVISQDEVAASYAYGLRKTHVGEVLTHWAVKHPVKAVAIRTPEGDIVMRDMALREGIDQTMEKFMKSVEVKSVCKKVVKFVSPYCKPFQISKTVIKSFNGRRYWGRFFQNNVAKINGPERDGEL